MLTVDSCVPAAKVSIKFNFFTTSTEFYSRVFELNDTESRSRASTMNEQVFADAAPQKNKISASCKFAQVALRMLEHQDGPEAVSRVSYATPNGCLTQAAMSSGSREADEQQTVTILDEDFFEKVNNFKLWGTDEFRLSQKAQGPQGTRAAMQNTFFEWEISGTEEDELRTVVQDAFERFEGGLTQVVGRMPRVLNVKAKGRQDLGCSASPPASFELSVCCMSTGSDGVAQLQSHYIQQYILVYAILVDDPGNEAIDCSREPWEEWYVEDFVIEAGETAALLYAAFDEEAVALTRFAKLSISETVMDPIIRKMLDVFEEDYSQRRQMQNQPIDQSTPVMDAPNSSSQR